MISSAWLLRSVDDRGLEFNKFLISRAVNLLAYEASFYMVETEQRVIQLFMMMFPPTHTVLTRDEAEDRTQRRDWKTLRIDTYFKEGCNVAILAYMSNPSRTCYMQAGGILPDGSIKFIGPRDS
jgi:hypothetical protein